MTPEEVRALQAMAEKADPGPLDIERRDRKDGTIDRIVHGPQGDFAWCVEDATPNARANAAFIVASRTAVPALCAALLEAWAENDRCHEDGQRQFVELTKDKLSWQRRAEKLYARVYELEVKHGTHPDNGEDD